MDTSVKTRRLKPGREHSFPGTRANNEWPPLTKCCNAEVFYTSHNGCDKEKIVFETHYYCQKCRNYLGFRRNETFFKKERSAVEE